MNHPANAHDMGTIPAREKGSTGGGKSIEEWWSDGVLEFWNVKALMPATHSAAQNSNTPLLHHSICLARRGARFGCPLSKSG
jgi:hypothetical protein